MDTFLENIKYNSFITTPKEIRDYTDGNLEYESLHTGGFVRLYTMKTKMYWYLQNETSHTTPDWKLHFSIDPLDVPRAWDIITKIFIENKCRTGMKAIMHFNDKVYDEESKGWPSVQRGREITVYIPLYVDEYNGRMDGMDASIVFSKNDEHSKNFWKRFINEVEYQLSQNSIWPNFDGINTTADGDYKLGTYASLRNESYVKNSSGDWIYPPNDAGYNGANHPVIYNHFQSQSSFIKRMVKLFF